MTVLSIIGGIRGAVTAVAGAAVGVGLSVLFYEGLPLGPLRSIPLLGPVFEQVADGRVDRERRAALNGFVLEVRAVAAEARVAELERQRNEQAIVFEEFRKRQAAEQQAEADREARRAPERKSYEKKLHDNGSRRGLTAGDIEWLRRP